MYDIANPKRLSRVAGFCENLGMRRLQKSVFCGCLEREVIENLSLDLAEKIDVKEDSVLIVPVSETHLRSARAVGLNKDLREMLETRDLVFL